MGTTRTARATPWAPAAVGLVAAAVAGAVVFRGIGRPALWLDEGATVVAVRRSWSGLFSLVAGADAPLVPYYALLKLVLGPGAAAARPEIWVRLPSAVAMVLAVAAMAAWAALRAGPAPALAAAGAMLMLDSVTRYAQEARPYGLVVLLAVVSTVARERSLHGRARWAALYAGSLAALVLMNTLAVALLLAHLIIAATGPARDRWRDLAQTGLLATAGLLIALPQAAAAVGDGGGAGNFPSRTPAHLAATFLRLFSSDGRLTVGAAAVLALAVLGLTRAGTDPLARAAAAWALAPLALLLPAVLVRPNLQIARYLMFTTPGWAVLAGLGLTVVGTLAAQAVARGRSLFEAAAIGVGLTVLVAAQGPGLAALSGPAGHGDDIRPVVAAAGRGTAQHLPVFIATRYGAVQFAAYAPARRLVNVDTEPDSTSVWPSARLGADIRLDLLRQSAVALVLHKRSDLACLQLARGPQARTTCLPTALRNRHYAARTEPAFGVGWALVVATRPAPYFTAAERRLRSTSTSTGINETTTTTAMIGSR